MQEMNKNRDSKRSKIMSAEHELIKATALKLVAIDPSANGFLSEMENILRIIGRSIYQTFHHLSLLTNLQASIKLQN